MERNKNSEKKITRVMEAPPGEVLSFCKENLCHGFPPPIKHREGGDDEDCPVCFESLNSKRVVRLDICRHMFCEECIQRYQTDKGCPMCRQNYDGYVTLTTFVACNDEDWQNLFDLHRRCVFNCNPIIKEFIGDLNDNWLKLVEFIFRSQASGEKYKGIKGIEYLLLGEQYCDEVLKTEKCYAVIKKATKRQIVMGCLLPYVSLRLVISQNEENDIQQDDEYADKVVGDVAVQLEACWRGFQSLLSRGILEHIFIRKFQTMTCSLMISGFQDSEAYQNHRTPMKEQIKNMKMCNFEVSLFKAVRQSFPSCDRSNMTTPRGYKDTQCCPAIKR